MSLVQEVRRGTTLALLCALQLGVLQLGALLAACGPTQSDNKPFDRDGGPDFSGMGLPCPVAPPDTDDDGISDESEGAHESPPRDTDHDGIPDFRDYDSDGDGIPDALEGRNGNACTPPTDSDGDGVPDFRDLDSDDATDSTLPDSLEAGPLATSPLDSDGDGEPDYMDSDDDGDGIPDILEMTAQGAAAPGKLAADMPDTDKDGKPDYLDLDSDNDTISDKDEHFSDIDGDLVPNYRDLDSDGDCVPDSAEAGDTLLASAPVDSDGDGAPDFADVDSDNDGLVDGQEDKNCSGVLDACETDRLRPDSDGDGATDLVEAESCAVKTPAVQASTMCACDGRDATKTPLTRGDFVFVVDYQKPPSPDRELLSLSTDVNQADVLFAFDTTGSMQAAINNLKSGLAALVSQVKAKVPDSAFGVYEFRDLGYPQDTPITTPPNIPSFRYARRVETVTGAGLTDVQTAMNALTALAGGDGPEAGWSALYTLAVGTSRSITVRPGVTQALATNPATLGLSTGETGGTIGGAGFRAGSVPIVVTISDAEWHDAPGSLNGADAESGRNVYPSLGDVGVPACDPCTNVPSRREAVTALQALGARVLGLAALGLYQTGNPKTRALKLAQETGALVSPADFGPAGTRPAGCAVGQCCTGPGGASEAPTGGQCPLSFSVNGDNGSGVSDAIVSGIYALSGALRFDVHVEAHDIDPGVIDNFLLRLEPNLSGMGAASLCVTMAPSPLRDDYTGPKALPGGDGVLDTFPGLGGGNKNLLRRRPEDEQHRSSDGQAAALPRPAAGARRERHERGQPRRAARGLLPGPAAHRQYAHPLSLAVSDDSAKQSLTEQSRDGLWLIDGSNFLFRAYHALPPLSTKAGVPSGAVFGFTQMLIRIETEHRPKHLAVIFDAGAHSFRNELYAEYKAHRPPAPEDLVPQFALVREVVEAFGLQVLEATSLEADDLIATLARRAKEAGQRVVILSSDKDLMQLVDDNCVLLDTMKNVTYDARAVQEKFGVPPSQLGDLLALMGDSVDNVPGVPGVGPKTAAALVQAFGGTENLIEHIDEVSALKGLRGAASVAEKLRANTESLRLSRKLVTLDEHAPLELELTALLRPPLDPARVGRKLRELDFTRLADRYAPAPAPRPRTPPRRCRCRACAPRRRPRGSARARCRSSLTRPCCTPSPARSAAHARSVSRFCAAPARASRPIRSASPSPSRIGPPPTSRSRIATCRHRSSSSPRCRASAMRCARHAPCATCTTRRRSSWCSRASARASATAPGIRRSRPTCSILRTIIRCPASRPRCSGISSKPRTSRRCPRERSSPGAARRRPRSRPSTWTAPPRTPRSKPRPRWQQACGSANGSPPRRARRSCSTRSSARSRWCWRRSSRTGSASTPRRSRACRPPRPPSSRASRARSRRWPGSRSTSALRSSCRSCCSVSSGSRRCARPRPGSRRTPTCSRSWRRSTPSRAKILDHRVIAKLKGTYLDALPLLVDPRSGRLHTSYKQTIAATGRLSSIEPNLQNVPIRTELGREIRRAFIADPGNVLVVARLLADRAARARAPVGRRGPHRRVPEGSRRPRAHRGRDVR